MGSFAKFDPIHCSDSNAIDGCGMGFAPYNKLLQHRRKVTVAVTILSDVYLSRHF